MKTVNRLMKAWNRYWFAPRSLINLAVLRIAAVGLELSLLITNWPVGGEFLRLDRDAAIYHPLTVLHLLTLPFGSHWLPPVPFLDAAFWVCVVAGFLGLIGLFTNPSLIVFALGSVFLQAFRYSFNDLHHPEAIMMFALTALALSPCGRMLSVDALRKEERRGFWGWERKSPFAGWPLLFMQWMIVLVYVSSAYVKLLRAGYAWANGYTLQYYLLEDGLLWHRPLGVWMAGQHETVVLLSWITLLFEATFILVMLFPRLRWIYVPIGFGLHAGIYVLMDAPFFELMALYAVFVPWMTLFQWIRIKLDPPAWPRLAPAGGLNG